MFFILTFTDRKKQVRDKNLIIIGLQMPLCVSIVYFSITFINYSKQELGNLSINYTHRQDMSDMNISTKMNFNNKEGKAYVLSPVEYTQSE